MTRTGKLPAELSALPGVNPAFTIRALAKRTWRIF